jgi:FMN reductase [NAD(P)H]
MSDETMPDHHGINSDYKAKEYPNETIKLLLERASCRDFLDKKIETEVMNNILEAGTKAASGGNLQPFSIIQIESEESKKKIVSWGNQPLIQKAPVNLLFCIDFYRNKQWAEAEFAPYSSGLSYDTFWISFQDTIIAAQNICTAADSFGLGSVYLGTVMSNLEQLQKLLNLPKGVIPLVLVAMGYPRTSQRPIKQKLSRDVIVHKEKYNYRSDEEIKDIFTQKYKDVKVEITPERLAIIKGVSRTVHGEEYADKCLAKIKEQGFISPSQRYFGLHYLANGLLQNNESFIKCLKNLGLDFFQNHDPAIPYQSLSMSQMQTYIGKYKCTDEGIEEVFEFQISNNKLTLRDSDNILINLFCQTENSFFAMHGDTRIKFSEDKKRCELIFQGKLYHANKLN